MGVIALIFILYISLGRFYFLSSHIKNENENERNKYNHSLIILACLLYFCFLQMIIIIILTHFVILVS